MTIAPKLQWIFMPPERAVQPKSTWRSQKSLKKWWRERLTPQNIVEMRGNTRWLVKRRIFLCFFHMFIFFKKFL